MYAYLKIVQHSESRHARGRRSEKGLQDGCCTGLLMLLLGGHRWRTRAWTLTEGEKRLLQKRVTRVRKVTEGEEGETRNHKLCAKQDILRYLVAPDAGFFGNKVIESVLHFRICWYQQQQLPHTKSDPVDYQRETLNKRAPVLQESLCDIYINIQKVKGSFPIRCTFMEKSANVWSL